MAPPTGLKLARMIRGMTQHQLASKINISEGRLVRLETGRCMPRVGEIDRIAAVLGCNASDLQPEDSDAG